MAERRVSVNEVESTRRKESFHIGKHNEAPRSKLRGITELNFEDFSEAEANPAASCGGMFKFKFNLTFLFSTLPTTLVSSNSPSDASRIMHIQESLESIHRR